MRDGPFILSLLFGVPPMSARAVEEPAYTVAKKLGAAIELRRYRPYVVAEVLIPGAPADAGSRAFPILAGYIFGKNQGERRAQAAAAEPAEPAHLPMTAPVTQTAAPAEAGEASAGTLVQFVLPRGTRLETAPLPLDVRVQLRELPARRVAVIRYSGFWTDSNDQRQLRQLRKQLDREGITPQGDPIYARYNAPFIPWFLRRNEIWLTLRPD